jgi:hypothetical protein
MKRPVKKSTSKALPKAQFGLFKKKEPQPVDSAKYFNNAMKYYQDLGDYRTAKGQTVEAAPAAYAERDRYKKKLADYTTRKEAKEASYNAAKKRIEEKGANSLLVEKKKKGGATKLKKKK